PPGWARAGGALAVLRFAIVNYWSSSYLGGSLAAAGGALALGALPRIKRHQRIGDTLLMGLGLALLANSRPYEGLVLSLPVGVALLVWLLKQRRPALATAICRVVLPLGLLLGVTGVALGYYIWRVSGSLFRLCYQLARETYAAASTVVCQSPRPTNIYRKDAI